MFYLESLMGLVTGHIQSSVLATVIYWLRHLKWAPFSVFEYMRQLVFVDCNQKIAIWTCRNPTNLFGEIPPRGKDHICLVLYLHPQNLIQNLGTVDVDQMNEWICKAIKFQIKNQSNLNLFFWVSLTKYILPSKSVLRPLDKIDQFLFTHSPVSPPVA